jgi:outer membrane protein assembly factor BamA
LTLRQVYNFLFLNTYVPSNRIAGSILLLGNLFLFAGQLQGSELNPAIPDSLSLKKDYSTVAIRKITITGNSVTKQNIIRREMMYAEGDTLKYTDFLRLTEQSKTNLLNTLLFNFVTINTTISPGDCINAAVTVDVTEQWYVWPAPIFEINDRNFNVWLAQHDFSRINYGIKVYWENFRGRYENLNFMLRLGKSQRISFSYDIPYINKRKKFGIGLAFNFDHIREVGYATINDHLQYLSGPGYLKKSISGSLHFSYRPGIHFIHDLSIGYSWQSFADTILLLNPSYSISPGSSFRSPEFFYRLRCDFRDNKNYPLNGWYSEFSYSHNGWNGMKTGSRGVDWIKFSVRRYQPVSKRFFTGMSADGKISTHSTQPYLLQSGLGYGREYVRGYELYVIDGQQFGLLKANLSYAVLPQTSFEIPYIAFEKFRKAHISLYLTAFVDAAYVWDRQWKGEYNNRLPNSLLLGSGLGLDVVTYYDKVFRLEYSVNKQGESGFFIHFMSTI